MVKISLLKKIVILGFINLLLLVPPPAFGQYLQPVAAVRRIEVTKFVQNPQTKEFFRDLSTGPKFLPGREVVFKVDVKNSGQAELTNIQVKDKLPDFLDFVSGPGNFDSSARTLNFSIDRLRPGETKSSEITVKVRPTDKLPANLSTCVTNFAEARVDDLVGQGTAVFCLESKVLAQAQELPVTGPGDSALVLIGSILLLILSIRLLKKTAVGKGVR